MALFSHSLKLLPLVLASSLGTAHAQAQHPLVAMLKAPQQPELPASRTSARGTSLESLLQELKTAHYVYFLYRSELVRDKFVNLEAMTFRNWEGKLTYAVTVSGLRVEKSDRNVYIISTPKPSAPNPQSIGGSNGPSASSWETPAATSPTVVMVRGQVTGPDKAPIPGVTVLVKNTTNGTTTDADGNFTLSLPEANAILVISAIGFVTQEVVLQGRTTLNVTLQTDMKALEEVVVLGYTTQKKADVTVAVSQIDQRDISSIPVTGVAQIMQGKAAGVAIILVAK